ncbi:phosphatase PAP2 family protein [Paenibacillus sp. N1-5-1-14]|uniref:phosphatase PAP2 family protein n=1 Tax=Paenibacillus radicibacter TaxID=2972488 RepID=UPI0021594C78|nr:phosphatase PAP2 family protein [Paenibacillus radicibacter]MCR8644111.1 phosphatase PAP2 family protein [Paenibacillus radicibacter]
MGPFESMTHVSIYTTICTIVLLYITTKKDPIRIAYTFVMNLIRSPRYLLHFGALVLILLMNNLELWVEKFIHNKTDFTLIFYSIEKEFVANIQHFFLNDTLTYVTSFFYVIVFSTLMIVSIALYTWNKNYQLFNALCYAIIINYVVAMPFYLFFQVNEVWVLNPNVNMLISNVFPTFEQTYREMSGINNCFPSLHTSLSITMAVIATHSGNAFWKWFTRITAGIIIFSIFYLGIHWFLDMGAGLILGVAASKYGLKIAQGRQSFKLPARVNTPMKQRSLSD